MTEEGNDIQLNQKMITKYLYILNDLFVVTMYKKDI